MIRWKVTKSNRWINGSMRSRVESFAHSFLQTHGWADEISITERFVGEPIWRRKSDKGGVPDRGATNKSYPPGSNQSVNTPLLVTRAYAEGRVLGEVAAEFPHGRETSDEELNWILNQVRLSLEAAGP